MQPNRQPTSRRKSGVQKPPSSLAPHGFSVITASSKAPTLVSVNSVIARHPKANGGYLAREFYNELNRYANVQRNPFSMPEELLRHTKAIKPKRKSQSVKSEPQNIYFFV